MVVWAYAYFVDNEKETVELKEGHTDYTHYIEFLLDSIRTSKKQSVYQTISNDTEVVSCVTRSVKIELDVDEKQKQDLIFKNCETIANRFLRKEIEAKGSVRQLPIEVRSGCLILAYIEEENSHQYLIAKMDWSEFLQRVNLNRTQGIEINKNRLGKSCLFTLNMDSDNNVTIINAQVLLDNKASYFCKDFLELTPIFKDDYNTETMVNTTLQLIDTNFRKKYPQDRLLLRNTFIHYVRTNDFIDYADIHQNIFEKFFSDSTCHIEEQDKKHFMEKSDKLPETKRFSRQFTRVPEKIKARVIQSKYKLTSFASLEIQDADQEAILSKIKSGKDDNGSTYLKIYTAEQEAIDAFKPEE